MKWLTRLRIYCLKIAKDIRLQRAQVAARQSRFAHTSIHLKAINDYADRIKSLEATLSPR